MGKEVAIPLKDLRSLVKLLYLSSISIRAQRLVRTKQPKDRAAIVKQYLSAVAEMVPDAKRREKVRFGELLASLRSGQDAPAALANFLVREGIDSSETQTRVRRPR